MELTVQRKAFSPNSTIGNLSVAGSKFVADGVFCATLEPRTDQSHGKPYAILAGRYQVKLLMSSRFGRIMPHVLDVPDFEGVLVHWGNYPKDTIGCTLVGEHSPLPDFIAHSVQTFDKFYDLMVKEISGGNQVWVTYTETA